MRYLKRLFERFILRYIRAYAGLEDKPDMRDLPPNLSDEQLARRYYDAACDFAEGYALQIIGAPRSLADELHAWEMFEEERLRRGYRTFPLECFIWHTACITTRSQLMQRRAVGEPRTAYARAYRPITPEAP